jgi:6-phosphogluconolactonase
MNSIKDWRINNPAKKVVLSDVNSLMKYIAEAFTELTKSVHAKREHFSVVFAGGRTPRELNAKLANMRSDSEVDWSRVKVFFSDERCVPPDHPDSNYAMIRDTLLRHVNINSKNVYRIEGELEPERAAQEYENLLCQVFGDHSVPCFDLALLGMGADGHTASLFPKHEVLREEKKFAAHAGKGPEGHERVTLTFPVLNHVKNVWFMISGKEKAEAVQRLLHGPFEPTECPAQFIRPVNGELMYMMEQSVVV